MRFLLTALLCLACAPVLGAPARSADFLSFAELYRVTVGGVSVVEFAAVPPQAAAQLPEQSSGYQIRTASLPSAALPAFAPAAAAPGAPAFAFSSAWLPQPSRWLVLLSGLALAAWVARRRLGYPL